MEDKNEKERLLNAANKELVQQGAAALYTHQNPPKSRNSSPFTWAMLILWHALAAGVGLFYGALTQPVHYMLHDLAGIGRKFEVLWNDFLYNASDAQGGASKRFFRNLGLAICYSAFFMLALPLYGLLGLVYGSLSVALKGWKDGFSQMLRAPWGWVNTDFGGKDYSQIYQSRDNDVYLSNKPNQPFTSRSVVLMGAGLVFSFSLLILAFSLSVLIAAFGSSPLTSAVIISTIFTGFLLFTTLGLYSGLRLLKPNSHSEATLENDPIDYKESVTFTQIEIEASYFGPASVMTLIALSTLILTIAIMTTGGLASPILWPLTHIGIHLSHFTFNAVTTWTLACSTSFIFSVLWVGATWCLSGTGNLIGKATQWLSNTLNKTTENIHPLPTTQFKTNAKISGGKVAAPEDQSFLTLFIKSLSTKPEEYILKTAGVDFENNHSSFF